MNADYAMNAEFYEVLFGMVDGDMTGIVWAYRPEDERAAAGLWSEMPPAANEAVG